MDDDLLDKLSRSLVTLENLGPKLDDLLFPRQAPPDGGGGGGSRPASKPPLSLSIVDLKVEVETCLRFWSAELVRAVRLAAPSEHAIAVQAAWLRSHLQELEPMPWAETAALDIIDDAWLVTETVVPPGRETVEPPAEGTARVIASWLSFFGFPLSRSQLQRHIAAGDLPTTPNPDGSVAIQLADALDIARKRL